MADRSKRSLAAGAVALLALLFTVPVFAQQALTQQATATEAAAQPSPASAPVIIDGETLFRLRGVSAFPAERRAGEIRNRILEAADDASVDPAQLVVRDEGDRTSIYAGEFRILTIVDLDAEAENLQRPMLAELYQQAIAKSIRQYRHERSAAVLLERSLYALGVTLVLALLLWAARRLFRWLDGWTERHIRASVDQLASKAHQLVRANAIWSIVAGLLRALRTVVYLLLAYFYLNTVLGLYPWTRPVALLLFGLVLDPLASLWSGFVTALPDLAFLVVLWFVVRYLLKIMRAFFTGIEEGRIKLQNFEEDWAQPTFKILRVAVVAFALVVAYPYIPGSSSDAFKGVSVFVGVLLSLGSSSLIANVIAGLSMTYRGAFRVGEIVKVGQVVGKVEDVKLMVTRVRTPKNEIVVLPNSNILGTEVVNYSQLAATEGLVLHTTVGIGYDTPWRQVEAMLLAAAARTDGIKSDPPPFVLQSSLGDFAVNYELNAFSAQAHRMPALYSALHANIQDVFNEHGVQIMSPAYEADPDTPKIVPPDQWYAEPARRPDS